MGTLYANPGSKTAAGDTFAALTRLQWDQYLQNFVPLENEIIYQATNPQVAADAVMNARTDVANAFDVQEGVQERRLRGLGLALDEDQQRAITRQTRLSESLADVNAANMTQQRVQDRQMGLLGAPSPQIQGG